MLHVTYAIHCTSQFISREFVCLYSGYRDEHPQNEAPELSIQTQPCLVIVPETADSTESGRPRSASVSSSGFFSTASSEADQIDNTLTESTARKPHDPENVFGRLFADNGDFDFEFLEQKTRGRRLAEVIRWCDVDHYNLLEKAVIFNSRELVRFLLTLNKQLPSRRFSFSSRSAPTDDQLQLVSGSIHLAAFLGCVDIIEEFLDWHPGSAVLRGPVCIRPVHGPPNDLFRIIGYSDFTKNPRLAFQMGWIRSHPNERPVHYAICGGYPMIMNMLMNYDSRNDERSEDSSGWSNDRRDSLTPGDTEKDALLVNLLRQAASCASYSCLQTLYELIPEAIYMRDERGWLYMSCGIPHGIQFLKFLMEQGFAIKLLNNIDGRNTVNALHVFYTSLSKTDRLVAKFSDLYDISELLLDLGVDINMETTALRSHKVSDTPLHILIDHVNLVLSAVTQTNTSQLDASALAEMQTIYDDGIRDTICLLLENGYDIEQNCYSLLKRLFMNRHFLKRFSRSKTEKNLVQANYGLRHMYNLAKLLLEAAEIRLCPARREITPALYLIDTLRDQAGVQCIFGDRRATQMFNNCLKLLFENGDNANIYPFFSNEDSYLASPLLHLCDMYTNHWCRNHTDESLYATLSNFLDTLKTIADSGANLICYMSERGNFFKHGVFDNFGKMFTVIHRQLNDADQKKNSQIIGVMNGISALLVKYGAEPVLQEYVVKQRRQSVSDSSAESTLLGHILQLGVHSYKYQDDSSERVIDSEEYKQALSFHMNLADHRTYYSCLEDALTMLSDEKSCDMQDDRSGFVSDVKRNAQNVRSLLHMSRLLVYECLKPKVNEGQPELPLPHPMLDYVIKFEI